MKVYIASLLVLSLAVFNLTGCNDHKNASLPKTIKGPHVNDSYILNIAETGEKISVINVKLLSEYGERIGKVLSLESVEVCSNKTCFSTDNILTAKPDNEFYDNKKAFTVAKIAITEFNDPFTHIKLNSKKGDSQFSETVQFSEPKTIKSLLYYLLLISIDEQVTGEKKSTSSVEKKWYSQLVPNFKAFVPISGSDKVHFYDKENGLDFSTENGFSISIEADSYSGDRVISFKETPHNIASSYYIESDIGFKLNKSALINIPFNDVDIPFGLTVEDYELIINNKPVNFQIIENEEKKFIRASIESLGVIHFIKKNNLAPPPEGLPLGVMSFDSASKVVGAQARISGCISEVAQLKSTADWYAENHGYYYFKFCENKAPFVNMAYINLDRAHNSYNSPYAGKSANVSFAYQSSGIQNTYNLRTITEHAVSSGADIAINGFTWDPYSSISAADTGRFVFMGIQLARGKGHFKGTVYDNHNSLNTHPSSGEASIGFSPPDHINNTKSKFYHRPSGDVVAYPYTDKLYSSTTSILHNSVCNITATNPGASNAWSAVGINAGKLLFISSFNSNATNTEELCEIFQAFGITNAIRNDGSTAASLYVDGRHINPLTGAARNSIGGPARRVLHAITVKVN